VARTGPDRSFGGSTPLRSCEVDYRARHNCIQQDLGGALRHRSRGLIRGGAWSSQSGQLAADCTAPADGPRLRSTTGQYDDGAISTP